MSSVSTLPGATDPTAASGTGANATTAKELNDRFLRLLIAQMNNQDPLNPLDNAEVTSQMAQINTVTGINGLNDTVGKLLEQFARIETMQAAQLTGRSVLVTGNALALPEGGPAVGGVELAVPVDSMTVTIRDAAGQVVRELPLGGRDTGITRFEWDGRTDAGIAAPAGNYSFSVTARSGTSEFAPTALAARRVEGVRQVDGAVQLVLAGAGSVAYSDIKQIL